METLRETSISTLAEAKRRHVAQLNIQTRKNKIRRINRILNRIGCGGDADRLKSYQCVVTKSRDHIARDKDNPKGGKI